MKRLLLSILALAPLMAAAQDPQKLHREALVVDTHNDVLIYVLRGLRLEDNLLGKTHSDFSRFKQGGIDVQFFSVWSDETYGIGRGFAYANRQIDSLESIIRRNPDKLALARHPKEIKKIVNSGRMAAMIGIEGGHMIEERIDYLDSLYRRGARYITLTWNNSTSWASAAKDESDPNWKGKPGLSEQGRNIVRRMNELGMLVDVSHVGEQTLADVLAVTNKPVLVSHSSVYKFSHQPRNLKDEQIRAIARNGGVIHLNFYSGFLDSNFVNRQQEIVAKRRKELDSLRKADPNFEPDEYLATRYRAEMDAIRPPLSILIDHIDHIVKLVGVDHVGLGSDFDGISSAPQGLNGVQDMPLVTKALLDRGYSKKDIQKILGGNFMRIFKANIR